MVGLAWTSWRVARELPRTVAQQPGATEQQRANLEQEGQRRPLRTRNRSLPTTPVVFREVLCRSLPVCVVRLHAPPLRVTRRRALALTFIRAGVPESPGELARGCLRVMSEGPLRGLT